VNLRVIDFLLKLDPSLDPPGGDGARMTYPAVEG